MKKLHLLTAICLFGCMAAAQPPRLTLKALTDSFFKLHTQTPADRNMFDRLNSAASSFFSPVYQPFMNAIFDEARTRGISIESSVYLLYDSVLTSYITTRVWDEFPGQPEAGFGFYKAFNNSLCPCLGKLNMQAAYRERELTKVNQCMERLTFDTAYVAAVAQLNSKYGNDEQQAMSQHAIRYSLQHCPALRAFFWNIAGIGDPERTLEFLLEKQQETDKKVFYFYKEKRLDKLILYFPEYKKHESHIKSALAVSDHEVYLTERSGKQVKPGQQAFTKIFYHYINNKPVITGQLDYVVNTWKEEMPVLSFRFTAANKIPNSKELLSKIEKDRLLIELPPPPMEELRPATDKKNRLP